MLESNYPRRDYKTVEHILIDPGKCPAAYSAGVRQSSKTNWSLPLFYSIKALAYVVSISVLPYILGNFTLLLFLLLFYVVKLNLTISKWWFNDLIFIN